MKVNEIMMGDYFDIVSVRGNEKLHFTNGRITAIENDRFVRVNGIRFHVNSLEGTKLTKEILEANGFVWKELNKYFSLWFSYDEGIFISSLSNGKWNIQTQFRQFNISCNIRYVHELQHALRIYGLNEMADNLKLTKKGDNDNE